MHADRGVREGKSFIKARRYLALAEARIADHEDVYVAPHAHPVHVVCEFTHSSEQTECQARLHQLMSYANIQGGDVGMEKRCPP